MSTSTHEPGPAEHPGAADALATIDATQERTGRSLRPSRRVTTLYGWTWVLGFAALVAINLRLTALGVPAPTLSLIWSGTALLVVGLLYLAGGALRNHRPQYVLGVWTLVTAVATVFVGYPANFAVLAIAGGGGFVVLGVWMHLVERR